MAKFPALPLFTDAYLADTEHLDDAEHGRYLRLLMLMWRSPDCRIPDDNEWIARRFRRDVEAVKTTIRPLIREFCSSNGNWLTQKRLLREWQWCRKKSEANTVSAKSRWNKKKPLSERSTANGDSRNAPYLEEGSLFPNGNKAPNSHKEQSAEADLFRRGREVLGQSAGGFIKNLLKAKGNNVPLARAAIETSATKNNPREYLGGVIHARSREQDQTVDPRL